MTRTTALVTLLAVGAAAFAVPEDEGKESRTLVQLAKEHPPAEAVDDRALVYVGRPSGHYSRVKMFLFRDRELLGINRGRSYFFAHVEPGTYVFWSKSENVDAVELEVAAGETYYLLQVPHLGEWKARTELRVLEEPEGEEMLARCRQHATPTDLGRERGREIAEEEFEAIRERLARKVEDGSGGNHK